MTNLDPRRTGYNRIDDVLLPEGAGTTEAWVGEADLRHVFKVSRWKFQNLHTAVTVLQRPDQIWHALRQVGEEETLGYAYVGAVRALRLDSGGSYPCPSDRVFVVFLDLRMTVLEWRTEVATPSGFVVGERFKELLWSRA